MRSRFLLLIALYILLPCSSFARGARTVYLNEKQTEWISVLPGQSTILSFPTRPTKVIVGNSGLFGVQYVENDLAISALRAGARSNMFVYIAGRRFGFDLRTVAGNGDEVVLVRDAVERKVKVRVQGE